jgi:hypothetical protein
MRPRRLPARHPPGPPRRPLTAGLSATDSGWSTDLCWTTCCPSPSARAHRECSRIDAHPDGSHADKRGWWKGPRSCVVGRVVSRGC